MKRIFARQTVTQNAQQGWMMLEVLLCLALFSIVLHLVQRQSEAQWHSLQSAQQQRQQYENQQKQTAMAQLVDDASWVRNTSATYPLAYPDCQLCRDSQLQDWFRASLHYVPQEGEP